MRSFKSRANAEQEIVFARVACSVGDLNAPALEVHSTITRAQASLADYDAAWKERDTKLDAEASSFSVRGERLKPETLSGPLTGSAYSRGRKYESGTILRSQLPDAVIAWGPVGCRLVRRR